MISIYIIAGKNWKENYLFATWRRIRRPSGTMDGGDVGVIYGGGESDKRELQVKLPNGPSDTQCHSSVQVPLSNGNILAGTPPLDSHPLIDVDPWALLKIDLRICPSKNFYFRSHLE